MTTSKAEESLCISPQPPTSTTCRRLFVDSHQLMACVCHVYELTHARLDSTACKHLCAVLENYVLDRALWNQEGYMGYLSAYFTDAGYSFLDTDILARDMIERIDKMLESFGVDVDNAYMEAHYMPAVSSVIFTIEELV